ncbi:MAG: hypothetical protein WCO44_13040 [Bacteroidota bacterium]
MADYHLSINQLVEFRVATDAGKRRIIRQQLNPDQFRVQWYQLAKACIRASIRQNCDPKPIYEGLKALAARKAVTKHQQSDKATSIEALERFLDLQLPSTLRSMHYATIKPLDKTVEISDVEITVAPEIVIRGEVGGKKVVGGVKIHISKGKPFDYEQSLQVAAVIYRFLEEKVALPGELVMPELCFSLDIFGDRIVQAPSDLTRVINSIDQVCNEVKVHWLAA